MPLSGARTYVGFGFGAIQAGLFLYEAFRSGAFGRLVVAEVLPEVVDAVRRRGGNYVVNIAHPDRVERAAVGPVAIEDPSVPDDRERLIEAVAAAEELGAAVPSVQFYVSAGPGSIHRLLAEGLRRKAARSGPRCVVYAAENHNHAAEILEEAVVGEVPAGERDSVRARACFLNTVIGKMSGVVTDAAECAARRLATVTPEDQRAFLVEAFNRILISRVRFPDAPAFQRGIAVFEEKDDLLPFENAKLYGHNATHALAAYLGAWRGVETIAELRDTPGMMDFLRGAFTQESGRALIQMYVGLDPLFTPEGYQAYADDLLARMTNPFLGDTAARVGRDPRRKLGWDDRLIGAMRLALCQGIEPWRYACGAAAALGWMDARLLETDSPLAPLLGSLWEKQQLAPAATEREQVVQLVQSGRSRLRAWKARGFGPLTKDLA